MTDEKCPTIQRYMDEAYARWQSDKNMSEDDWRESLSPREAIAVNVGNLNYQVENGGFSQWHYNGYSENLPILIKALQTINNYHSINSTRTVLRIVLDAQDVIENHDPKQTDWIEYGYYDENDEWIDESYEDEFEVEPEFGNLDSEYYDANKDFLIVVEMLLGEPDEIFLAAFNVNTSPTIRHSHSRPRVRLIGQDSNIFNIAGIARKSLTRAGMHNEATEMTERISLAKNYDHAISIIMEYVDAY